MINEQTLKLYQQAKEVLTTLSSINNAIGSVERAYRSSDALYKNYYPPKEENETKRTHP